MVSRRWIMIRKYVKYSGDRKGSSAAANMWWINDLTLYVNIVFYWNFIFCKQLFCKDAFVYIWPLYAYVRLCNICSLWFVLFSFRTFLPFIMAKDFNHILICPHTFFYRPICYNYFHLCTCQYHELDPNNKWQWCHIGECFIQTWIKYQGKN